VVRSPSPSLSPGEEETTSVIGAYGPQQPFASVFDGEKPTGSGRCVGFVGFRVGFVGFFGGLGREPLEGETGNGERQTI